MADSEGSRRQTLQVGTGKGRSRKRQQKQKATADRLRRRGKRQGAGEGRGRRHSEALPGRGKSQDSEQAEEALEGFKLRQKAAEGRDRR